MEVGTRVGERRWLEYCSSQSWKDGNLDAAAYETFLRAASLEVDPQRALDEVGRLTLAANLYARIEKLPAQLERAYAYVSGKELSRGAVPRIPRPEPVRRQSPVLDSEVMRSLARRAPPHISAAWLKRHSIISLPGITPENFLTELSEPGERFLVFEKQRSYGQAIWKHGDSLTQFYRGKKDGVWFLCQPVNGQMFYNRRL